MEDRSFFEIFFEKHASQISGLIPDQVEDQILQNSLYFINITIIYDYFMTMFSCSNLIENNIIFSIYFPGTTFNACCESVGSKSSNDVKKTTRSFEESLGREVIHVCNVKICDHIYIENNNL